jgi:hypothetical protein
VVSVTKIYRPGDGSHKEIMLTKSMNPTNEKPLLRFCPKHRILRSFAVLRRFSLAALVRRLRQAQDDKTMTNAEYLRDGYPSGARLGWVHDST